jgi:hypothetical protein
MSKIYTTKDDNWQMTVRNRSQGWQVQVTQWDGDNFTEHYDAYVIADSLFEATFGALADSGFNGDFIESQLDDWGIFAPDEGEDN